MTQTPAGAVGALAHEALAHLRRATGALSAAACANPKLEAQADRLALEAAALALALTTPLARPQTVSVMSFPPRHGRGGILARLIR